MIDPTTIPDPGEPRADGYYLQHARAALRSAGVRTPEDFAARFGVDIRGLTAFGLLWTVDRTQAERELHLNELYRAGLPRYQGAGPTPAGNDAPLVATYSAAEWIALRTLDRWRKSGALLGLPAHVELPGYFVGRPQLLSRVASYLDDARRSDEHRGDALRWIVAAVDYLAPYVQVRAA